MDEALSLHKSSQQIATELRAALCAGVGNKIHAGHSISLSVITSGDTYSDKAEPTCTSLDRNNMFAILTIDGGNEAFPTADVSAAGCCPSRCVVTLPLSASSSITTTITKETAVADIKNGGNGTLEGGVNSEARSKIVVDAPTCPAELYAALIAYWSSFRTYDATAVTPRYYKPDETVNAIVAFRIVDTASEHTSKSSGCRDRLCLTATSGSDTTDPTYQLQHALNGLLTSSKWKLVPLFKQVMFDEHNERMAVSYHWPALPVKDIVTPSPRGTIRAHMDKTGAVVMDKIATHMFVTVDASRQHFEVWWMSGNHPSVLSEERERVDELQRLHAAACLAYSMEMRAACATPHKSDNAKLTQLQADMQAAKEALDKAEARVSGEGGDGAYRAGSGALFRVMLPEDCIAPTGSHPKSIGALASATTSSLFTVEYQQCSAIAGYAWKHMRDANSWRAFNHNLYLKREESHVLAWHPLAYEGGYSEIVIPEVASSALEEESSESESGFWSLFSWCSGKRPVAVE